MRYDIERQGKDGWSKVATGMSMSDALEMFNELANEFPEWSMRVADHTGYTIRFVNR